MSGLSQLVAGDWIAMGARRWPDRRCFIDGDGRERTYAEAADRVDRLSEAMLASGLQAGDRVAILATDSIEHVELVMACLRNGVMYCDLNFRLREGELRNVVGRAQPRAIFYSGRYADLTAALADGHTGLTRYALDAPPGEQSEFEALLESGRPAGRQSVPRGEDIVSIAFTSGTTGIPKGVMQSERMLRNIVYSGIREHRVPELGLRYSGAPLFHISGIAPVFYGMVAGSTSLILPQFDAPTVLQWMQHGGLTHCTLIPTMISSLLDLPGARDRPYPELVSILYGGAPMSPTLLRDVYAVFDCDLYNGFGPGTEAGAQTVLYPEDHRAALAGKEHLLSSVGRPILGVDVRICDDELVDVPRGEVGEVVSRSETVMSGYFGDDELTRRAVVDGWFRAGDMARMDDEGYIYLATRKADMIIRGGENVYPVEIEAVLAEHPAVLHACVVGLPDPHWGETVAAAVVFRSGAAADAEELREFCRERLASYKVPTQVAAFDDLPRNSTGKFLKREVVALITPPANADG